MPFDLDGLLAPTASFGAEWSVAIRRDDEVLAEHRPGSVLSTASVAKVFVLVELAGRLVRGEIDPGHPVDRRDTVAVHDSGLWHAMRADVLPVVDVAMLVGAVSDNWATNALIDLCGLDRVHALASTLAPGGSTLLDHVRDVRTPDDPTHLSEGCAADWVSILRRLSTADGIESGVCELVRGWLAQSCDLSMVASAFDLDPLAHDLDDFGLEFWNKTGTNAGVRADIGVVRSPVAEVTYAVLCNWPAVDEDGRGPVLSAMRRIGEAIRREVGRPAG